MTSPFLEPVASRWVRAAGIVLLLAAAALTAVLGYELLGLAGDAADRRTFNSSTLIFGLILSALCLMCWQAGWRLAFRTSQTGSLFSRPAWFAIGLGLVVVTALMAGAIITARKPTIVDLQVILFLGGIGVWCVVLAFR